YDIDNIAKIIINIDHHKNNKKFGDLNIVEFSPSTGYLLYKMAIYFNVSISKQMAEYLFISLAWDTNYFSNNFTNAECFTIASHLISLGAIPSRVYNNLFCYKKRNDLEIQKYLINNIKTYNDIYYITVPYDLQIDSIDVFNFISYINNLSNIRYFILFIQIDDTHYEIKTNNNSNLFNYLKSKYEELYKIKISKSFEQDILKVLKDFDNY
ncbi:MAG: hypothetical protein N2485_08545, partial [bacterium]|nr:hypothetical protein [bacterium]